MSEQPTTTAPAGDNASLKEAVNTQGEFDQVESHFQQTFSFSMGKPQGG